MISRFFSKQIDKEEKKVEFDDDSDWKKKINLGLMMRDEIQKNTFSSFIRDYEEMMKDYLNTLNDNIHKTKVYRKILLQNSEILKTEPHQKILELKSDVEEKNEQ